MHVVATDTIVADIAEELELTPAEAELAFHDVFLDDLEDDGDDIEFGDLRN